MDVKLFGFVDVVADAIQDDHFQEALGDGRGAGDEDFGGFVAGVGCPFVGAGYGEDVFPVRDGGKDFEGFGQLARFVSGEEEADSGGHCQLCGKEILFLDHTLYRLLRLWGATHSPRLWLHHFGVAQN